MSIAEFEDALLTCVRDCIGDSRKIDASTPLLNGDLLDSLGLIDLMSTTEALLMREMADEEFELKYFRTVGTIVDHFYNNGRAN